MQNLDTDKMLPFFILLMTLLAGCQYPNRMNSSDWFIKSVKRDARGDTMTLLHAGKTYIARCKGEKFATDERIYEGSICPYLTQHVGATFQDGKGIGEISRPAWDILYYRDRAKQTYEIWEVIQETTKQHMNGKAERESHLWRQNELASRLLLT